MLVNWHHILLKPFSLYVVSSFENSASVELLNISDQFSETYKSSPHTFSILHPLFLYHFVKKFFCFTQKIGSPISEFTTRIKPEILGLDLLVMDGRQNVWCPNADINLEESGSDLPGSCERESVIESLNVFVLFCLLISIQACDWKMLSGPLLFWPAKNLGKRFSCGEHTRKKWMCFLQHLFSLSKGKETKELFNAYQVSARSLHMLSHFIFQLREV